MFARENSDFNESIVGAEIISTKRKSTIKLMGAVNKATTNEIIMTLYKMREINVESRKKAKNTPSLIKMISHNGKDIRLLHYSLQIEIEILSIHTLRLMNQMENELSNNLILLFVVHMNHHHLETTEKVRREVRK